jgi:hypothetical protein
VILSKGGRSLLKTGKGGGFARLMALKLKLLVLLQKKFPAFNEFIIACAKYLRTYGRNTPISQPNYKNIHLSVS